MLTLRMTTPADLPALISTDVKSQEFPWSKEQVAELMELTEIKGVIVSNVDPERQVDKVGFALFSIQDEGALVDISRFSVLPTCVDDGVPEKIVTNLTEGPGPSPRLRYIISENEIETPFFDKLIELGFRGVGVAPDRFREYGLPCDGIKLERP